jgi:hypothetical protein
MVQALSMDKFYKYNSVQTLVHRDCHQLPKPHMGAPYVLSPSFYEKLSTTKILYIYIYISYEKNIS